MKFETYKNEIRNLIASDNLSAAIEKLKLLTQNSPALNEKIIIQSARHQHIKKEIISGVNPVESANLNKNQIRLALLDLISEIEELIQQNPKIKKELDRAISNIESKNVIVDGNISAGGNVQIGDEIKNDKSTLGIFQFIIDLLIAFPITIWSLLLFPFYKFSEYLNRRKFKTSIIYLNSLGEKVDDYFYEITYIRSKTVVSVSIFLKLDFEKFDKEKLEELSSEIQRKINLDGQLKVKGVESGSVIVTFELNSKDAENLFLAVKTGKLSDLNVNDATLVEFRQKEIEGKFDLKEIKEKLLKEIAVDFETGLEALYELLNKNSSKYNDFVQLKSSFNQTKKLFSQGLIDYQNFKIDMNKAIQFSISLVNHIIRNDVNRNTATNKG